MRVICKMGETLRAGQYGLSFRVLRRLRLLLPFPHDSAEIGFTWGHYARCRCRLDKELIALESKVTPLLRTIPFLIPRNIHDGEVVAFNAEFATVRVDLCSAACSASPKPPRRFSAVVNAILRPSRVKIRKPLGCDPKTFFGGWFSTITCHETSLQTPIRLSASAAERDPHQIKMKIANNPRMIFLLMVFNRTRVVASGLKSRRCIQSGASPACPHRGSRIPP